MQLGRFHHTVIDTAGNAVSGASVTVYREGATVNGNQSGTSPLTVTVRHRGKIAASDTAFVEDDPATEYTVDSVTATTVVLSGFAGSLSVTNGDRIVPSNNLPTLYGDDQGGATTANPLITSTTGLAQAFAEAGAYDFVVSGGTAATTLFQAIVTSSQAPGQIRYADEFAVGSSTGGIQEAINDLPSTGGVVYVGGGDKTITASVDCTGLTNVDVTLAQDCVVTASGIGNNPMFKFLGGAARCTLQGGTIDAASDAGECVRIGGTADRITVRDCLIKGADTAARSAIFMNGTLTNIKLLNLVFRGCEEAGIAQWDGSTASVIGLVIDGIDYNSTNGGGTNASSSSSAINLAGVVKDFVITNIRAQLAGRVGGAVVGIDDAGGALSERGVISNIVGRGANATDAESFGVVLSKANGVAILNVRLEDLGFTGVEVSESLANANEQIVISNVTMKNVGSNGQNASSTKSALSVADCRRVAVSNIVIEGSTNSPGRAINITDATDCVFTNISIKAGGNGTSASTGINIGSAATENRFSNIRIDGFAGDGIFNQGDNNHFNDIEIVNITDVGEVPIASVAGAAGNIYSNIYFSGNTLGNSDTDDANYVDVNGGQVQAITAVGNTLKQSASLLQLTSDGSYTLTSTPTVPNGTFDGQILRIVNVDTVDTITIQDQGTLPSSNLRLGAATRALAPRDNITLMYSATIGDWVELSFNNVT